MPTELVTLRGIPLEVDFSYTLAERGRRDSLGAPEQPDLPEEIDIEEIRHEGYEILCIMDDRSISEVRDLILKGREKR